MAARDCPACRGEQCRVAVAVAYLPLRRMIAEYLERDHECWSPSPMTLADLGGSIGPNRPNVVIVDAADFPQCCRLEFGGFPPGRFVVIGREADDAYRAAALAGGAGGWVAADAVGEELSDQLHLALGCEKRSPSVPLARTDPSDQRGPAPDDSLTEVP